MAGDVANPRVWLLADVYVAPIGSTEPTNTTTALDAAWEALGLLSEDGMSESRDEDATDHYAYGGILVRQTRTRHKRSFKVTVLEDTPAVFDLVNPGSTASTSGGITTRTVVVPTTTPNPKAFLFELTDGDVILRRVIPRGEVTEVGEVAFTDNEMRAFELTITVYADDAGVLYTDITDDTQAA